jgi:hypothetical protein
MPGASGSVYVFNLTPERLNLVPNGSSAGSIPPWGEGGSSVPYQPAGLKVGRVMRQSEAPGHFANGSNSVGACWDSGNFNLTVSIDGSRISLSQDLILLISKNRWDLCDSGGVQMATGEVTFR